MWQVKDRLERTLESLTSVESFEVKAMEIDNVLSRGSLEELLQHIDAMKNCFATMRTLSSHLPSQRRSFEHLNDKLLAFATPLLSRAIQEADFTTLSKLGKVYDIIDKSSVLIEKYAKLEESIFMKMFADKLLLLEHVPSGTAASLSKGTWISTFLGTLTENVRTRKSVMADVVGSGVNQLNFYKSLMQIILSKMQDTMLDKQFADDVSVHAIVYDHCLQQLYDLAASINAEHTGTDIFDILLRPCKDIVAAIKDRYLAQVVGELKKVGFGKYNDFELKDARRQLAGVVERLRTFIVAYKSIAVQYQLGSFLGELRRAIETQLQTLAGELERLAPELHGGVSIALLDGQTDREPQPAFASFDWKRIQLAAIQFDIVQDFLAALDALQTFVKANAAVPKTQECHLLAYSHYLDYLQLPS